MTSELVRRFRKKPVVIEAIRLDKISNDAVVEFMGGKAKRNIDFSINNRDCTLRIITLDGTMTARAGDWIIKGVKGEYYPCKHDIFEETYELNRLTSAAPAEGVGMREAAAKVLDNELLAYTAAMKEATNDYDERGRLSLVSTLLETLSLRIRALPIDAATEQWVCVPKEPREDMWGGLARDLVMWRDLQRPTGHALYKHLRDCGRDIPAWLFDEIPNTTHVPSKGTVAVCIYKAMLDAAMLAQSSPQTIGQTSEQTGGES